MVDPGDERPSKERPRVRQAPPRVLRPGAQPGHPELPGPTRPRPAPPPRPEFAVAPMRAPEVPATVPTALFGVMLIAWVAVFLLVVALAFSIYSDFDSVRTSLETGLSRQNPDSSATRVADTIRITLFGSGAISVVLLIAAAAGLRLLNQVRNSGRVVLIVAGIAGTAAGVTFWTLMADAKPSILYWGPLAVAAACAVGGVTALFAAPRRAAHT